MPAGRLRSSYGLPDTAFEVVENVTRFPGRLFILSSFGHLFNE